MPDIFKKFILRIRQPAERGGQKKFRKISKAIIFVMIIAVFFVNLKYAMAADDALPGLANGVLGGVGMVVAQILALIAYVLTAVIGLLITVVVALLVQVAQYGNIINVPTVIKGWVIIRDLCNMSFILILLIIAFATILRQENFSAKKMLPKLLLMAILINFSRTIFGLLIDVSQIIMLTFVNAFAAGGGWFVQAFQIDKLLTIKGDTSTTGNWAVSQWSTAMAVIAGVLASIIALIVLCVILAVLVARIVMLWIYTIFSPLIFLGFAFQPLQKYTGKLWEDFTKQLVVGPVLAFFIWLALTTASPSAAILGEQNLITGVPTDNNTVCVGAGAFFCTGSGGNAGSFQKFIIVIGLLMGGLMVAQSMGGAAGSIAGKGLDWAKRSPMMLGKGAMGVSSWGARKVKSGVISEMLADKKTTKVLGADGKWTDRVSWKSKVPGLGGLASALYGLELRPTKMIQGFKEGLKHKAAKEESEATGASAISLKKGGIGGLIKGLGVSRDLTEAIAGPGGFLWHKGFKQTFQATALGGSDRMQRVEVEIKNAKANRGVTQKEYDERNRDISVKKYEKNEQIKESYQKREAALVLGNNTEAAGWNELWLKQKEELAAIRAEEYQVKAMKRNIVADDVRLKQDKSIDNLEAKLKTKRPIQTFYADREHDKLISEAKSTLGDNDNAEYLVDAFQDALRKGNKELAQAVMLHATQVGHLNEIVNSYKSKEDVHDENSNILVRRGESLPAGAYGLHELVKQALIKDLMIDEQTAYSTQSEASTIAKSIKHTAMSETIGTKNGMLYQRNIEGPGGQQQIARGEARKVDAEKYSRDYNRLAYGDEFDTPSGRYFRFNALGLDTITENAGSIEEELGRKRFNKNAAYKFTDDAATLRAWAKKLHDEGIHYNVYDAKNEKTVPKDYMELVEKLLAYGQDVADLQKKGSSISGGNIKDWQKEILKNQQRPT